MRDMVAQTSLLPTAAAVPAAEICVTMSINSDRLDHAARREPGFDRFSLSGTMT